MKTRHPEDDLQRTVAKYLDLMGYDWFHVPNGGYRNRVEAARLKGLGVKSGVPDIIIVGRHGRCLIDPTIPDWSWSGIAIELKSPVGKLSKSQEHWLRELDALGWLTGVARSLDEVIAMLDQCKVAK